MAQAATRIEPEWHNDAKLAQRSEDRAGAFSAIDSKLSNTAEEPVAGRRRTRYNNLWNRTMVLCRVRSDPAGEDAHPSMITEGASAVSADNTKIEPEWHDDAKLAQRSEEGASAQSRPLDGPIGRVLARMNLIRSGSPPPRDDPNFVPPFSASQIEEVGRIQKIIITELEAGRTPDFAKYMAELATIAINKPPRKNQ